MSDTETRVARIMISSPGGNASKSAKGYRITIPNSWAAAWNISPDNRKVLMTFDGEKIIIEKAND